MTQQERRLWCGTEKEMALFAGIITREPASDLTDFILNFIYKEVDFRRKSWFNLFLTPNLHNGNRFTLFLAF